MLLLVFFSHLVCSFLFNVFYDVYNVFSTCRTSKCLTSPIVCGPKLWGSVGPLLYYILYTNSVTLYCMIYTIQAVGACWTVEGPVDHCVTLLPSLTIHFCCWAIFPLARTARQKWLATDRLWVYKFEF